MNERKGRIAIIGGGINGTHGEGVEYARPFHQQRQNFEPLGVLRFLLSQCRGEDSRITIITSASEIPDEVAESHRAAFAALGVTIRVLDCRTAEDANRQEAVDLIADADMVFLCGGQQDLLRDRMAGTRADQAIRSRLAESPDFLLAGTSAGAAAMAGHMVNGGSGKAAVSMMREGFGHLPFLVDTHVERDGRKSRCCAMLEAHPELRAAILLQEDTGLLINGDGTATAFGSGEVGLLTFERNGCYLPAGIESLNTADAPGYACESGAGMIVQELSAGDALSLHWLLEKAEAPTVTNITVGMQRQLSGVQSQHGRIHP